MNLYLVLTFWITQVMKNEVYLSTVKNGKQNLNIVSERDMDRHIYDFLSQPAGSNVVADIELIRNRGVNFASILKDFISYLENDADNPKMADSDEEFCEYDESDDFDVRERCQRLDIR